MIFYVTCCDVFSPCLGPIVRKIYVGSDPMEEARRITGLMGLDHIQYRWVGAILCRGVGRLKRPVVLSTHVKIADGPRRARQSNKKQQSLCWNKLPILFDISPHPSDPNVIQSTLRSLHRTSRHEKGRGGRETGDHTSRRVIAKVMLVWTLTTVQTEYANIVKLAGCIRRAAAVPLPSIISLTRGVGSPQRS